MPSYFLKVASVKILVLWQVTTVILWTIAKVSRETAASFINGECGNWKYQVLLKRAVTIKLKDVCPRKP
jgi:hypothetical protein